MHISSQLPLFLTNLSRVYVYVILRYWHCLTSDLKVRTHRSLAKLLRFWLHNMLCSLHHLNLAKLHRFWMKAKAVSVTRVLEFPHEYTLQKNWTIAAGAIVMVLRVSVALPQQLYCNGNKKGHYKCTFQWCFLFFVAGRKPQPYEVKIRVN